MSVVLYVALRWIFFFFFFNDTATTEIYTLSLHDALPISCVAETAGTLPSAQGAATPWARRSGPGAGPAARSSCRRRSEEHTSELQSQSNLVCRLLLEKKKNKRKHNNLPNTNSPGHARRCR